jgi:sRNA-binding carbon storage regulator CsrA
MLVLTRGLDEKIIIGGGDGLGGGGPGGPRIVLTIVEVSPTKIRIGIEAPDDVPIRRAELPNLDKIRHRAGDLAGRRAAHEARRSK